MKKVLITRYGAYGDHIHATHLPRLLKEKAGFDYVAFQYNVKGQAIYVHNPFIDEHIFFEPMSSPINMYPSSFFEKRNKELLTAGGFEKHVNLQNSIEYGYIAMEDMNEYYLGSEERRALYGQRNYYDQTTVWAGYPEHVGARGELFFSEQEEAAVRRIYRERYQNKFVIIANLSGTSKHKLFYKAEEIIKGFLKKHEDAVCLLVGDQDCFEKVSFEGERIINRCRGFASDQTDEYVEGTGEVNGNGYPFRQAMLMTKYADLVIGAESGLMVASTLLGAPTVQLMTAASIKNHGGDFANDYSLQSPTPCAPCHKGPYDYIGCPKFEHMGLKYPVCIKFDSSIILKRMEEVYDHARHPAQA